MLAKLLLNDSGWKWSRPEDLPIFAILIEIGEVVDDEEIR